MKRTVIFAAFAALLSFFSCSKEIETVVEPVSAGSDVVFTATLQQPTKANISSYSIEWEVGDKIAVYDGAAWCESDALAGGDIVGNVASFKFTANPPAAAATYYAVYPATAASAAPVGDALTVTLPAVQNIISGCVAKDALVQVCKADNTNDLEFVNVTSLIEFKVPDDNITSVYFEAVPDGTFALGSRLAIAGDASVSSVSPEANVTGTASRVVVNGAFVSGENYFAVVYPASTVGKYRFTFTKIDPTDGAIKAFRTGSADNVTSFPLNGGWKFETFGLTAGSWLGPLSTKTDLEKWVSAITYYQADETVKLGANINYGGVDWAPVDGNEATGFAGAIDGRNYSIYGIKIDTSLGANCGFFSTLESVTPRVRVENLKLGYVPDVDGNIDGDNNRLVFSSATPRIGGNLAGICRNATINNVHSYMRTVINYAATEELILGGIVGETMGTCSFSQCTNDNVVACTASALNTYLGGIAGALFGTATFSYCQNNAEVKRTKVSGTEGSGIILIGGIVGRSRNYTVENASTGHVIDHCTNNGLVDGIVGTSANMKCAQLYIGGILGIDGESSDSNKNVVVSYCVNNANVGTDPTGQSTSGKTAVGAIVGKLAYNSSVTNCTNLGTVIKQNGNTNQYFVGGIVGQTECDDALVEDCVNGELGSDTKGKVDDRTQTKSTNQRIGGIVGYASSGTIRRCTNYAPVVSAGTVSKIYIGGIIGNIGLAKMEYCNSYGPVSLTASADVNDAVGGLIGLHNGKAELATGEGCIVGAVITGGHDNSRGAVVGRYNQGEYTSVFGTSEHKITVTSACSVGGTAVTAGNFESLLAGPAAVITASGVASGYNTIWAAFSD